MKILALPNILTIHLKRFKYQTTRYIKLSYRVLFPTELRLFNTADETENPDRLYLLFAVVVHIGNGPYHGHYITLIRSPATNQWYLFDDDQYEMIPESELEKYFGDFGKGGGGNGTGYIFFYQAADFDASELISTMKQGKTSSIPRSQTPSMSPRSNSQSTTTGSVNATSTTTYFDSKSDKTNFANNSDTQQQKFGNFFNIKKMKASAKANNSGVNSQSFSEKSESTLDQQLQVPLSTSVPNSQYSSRFDEYPPMPSTASSPIPAVSTPTTHEDDTNTSTSTPTYRDYRKQSTSGQSYASATTSSNVSVAIGSSGVGGNKSSGNLSYTTGVSANYSPSVPVSEYLSVSGSSDKLSKSNGNGNNGNGGNGGGNGGMSGGSNVFKKVYKKFVSVSIPQTQGFEDKEKLDLGKSKSLGANVVGSSGNGFGIEENQSGGMSWNWKIKRDRAKSDVSSQK
ncbi:hypothetical protein HK098_003500 [Nowakowskiella sp. JEL0407]|nr:hypothetical protein HK098_003500 [Nowakowskiella sp. JEL0407]